MAVESRQGIAGSDSSARAVAVQHRTSLTDKNLASLSRSGAYCGGFQRWIWMPSLQANRRRKPSSRPRAKRISGTETTYLEWSRKLADDLSALMGIQSQQAARSSRPLAFG